MSQAARIDSIIGSIVTSEKIIGGEHFVISQSNSSGQLIYGPYIHLSAGSYSVEFLLGIDDIPVGRLGDFPCATVDVYLNRGATLVTEHHLRVSQVGRTPTPIRVEFHLQEEREVEFRVSSTGQAGLLVGRYPRLTPLPAPSSSQAILPPDARARLNEREFFDGYLRNVSGVIHIGANTGQERFLYQILGLDVNWVEAIPDVFQELVDNIAGLARQQAIKALLSNRVGESYSFNVSSHGGGSSSILAFDEHAKIMPDITYVNNVDLVSTTFAELVRNHSINLEKFQALIIDAEGAEELILEGAAGCLDRFKYIQCEVSDFPSRKDSPTSADLDSFLSPLGFRQLVRNAFAFGPNNNGTYWNIVWTRAELGESDQVDLPLLISKTWDRVGL